VPATESSHCQCAAITTTLSSDGRTWTERLSQDKDILTSDTTLIAVWKQLQFDITLKDTFKTDSVIKGASNGKFTLPVRSHNDYTFIGWKNKDGQNFHQRTILTSDTTLIAVWKQLQFDITLKDSFQTDSVIKVPATESSRCQCAAITTTLSSDGRTRTERLSPTAKTSSPATPLWWLSGSSCNSTSR
jgi:hypothetical protein